MEVKRLAAAVTLGGGVGVTAAVGLLAGGEWALLCASGLAMSAGVWNLIQE